MSLITLPIDLVGCALDDVGAIARVARELPDRLDTPEARTEKVQEQLDRALALGETTVERLGRALDRLPGGPAGARNERGASNEGR